jgi:hypothetical protein
MRRAVLTAPAQLGVASVLLLLACLQWAHHWGQPRTDVLVTGWGGTAFATLALGVRRRAKLPLALAAVSVLALVAAGVVWAAGYDVAGACGGG